jgi:aryl sulfotransferase
LNDLDREMRRIAKYLDIEIDEEIWPTLVDNTTFRTMKRNAEQFARGGGSPFIGGAQRFLFKGTNGCWKDTLSAETVALYEETVTAVLTPDCASWLERGRLALQQRAYRQLRVAVISFCPKSNITKRDHLPASTSTIGANSSI